MTLLSQPLFRQPLTQAKKVWKLKDEKLSVKRLQLLLERIGLTEARKHNDTDAVKAFVHLRNDAVHPEKLADLSPEKIAESFSKALQWLEEALLWRLGYTGMYVDRSNDFVTSTEPRYDCTLRDPAWDLQVDI